MSRLLFLLLFCAMLQTFASANSDPDGDVARILQKLNSDAADRVYNRADLIYAEFKADRTEKEVGVLVKFQRRDCEGECEAGAEICKGLFEEGELTDVSCLPAADRSIEQPSPSDTVPEIPEEPLNIQPCVGCPFDLNKNVEGLDELLNTALKHVESERANKHVVVNVLRVQQQIVAGVKYILLVEIAPTNCLKDDSTGKNCAQICSAPTEICQIQFLQQPWISRRKQIISNNCTYTQEFTEVPQRNSRENEIAGSGKKNGFVDERFSDADSESNSDWLAELESQIFVKNGGETNEEVPSVKPLEKRVDLGGDVESLADDFFGNEKIETTTDFVKVTATTEFSITSTPLAEKIAFEEDEEANNTSQENFDADDASEEEKKIRKQRIDPENKSISLSSLEEQIKNDDLDKRFIRSADSFLSESSKSSKSNSDSSEERKRVDLDKRLIRAADSSSSESSQSSKSSSDSSEERKRNEINKRFIRSADSSSSESKESLEKSNSNSDSSEEKKRPKQKRSTTPLEKITCEEKPLVRHLAEFAASTLDNIDDDNHKRIVLQVLGAKKMKMQGTLYHLTLRIGVSHCFEEEYDESCKDKLLENLTKVCKVQVHVGEDQFSQRVLKSQCQTIKKDNSDINRTTHNRFRRALVGGKTKIPTDDPQINDLLLTSLPTAETQLGAENKLKPVEIISATRQTVSGQLYTIKARLTPSTCTQNSVTPLTECDLQKDTDSKVCEFTIWQRKWLKTAPEVTVTCDEGGAPPRRKREIISDSFEKFAESKFDAEYLFKRFVRAHKKMYASIREFKQRFKIFRRNLKHIQFLNSNERGTARYGVTKFADLTRKEFAQHYLGYRPELSSENEIPWPQAEIPEVALPSEFDWRGKGAVSAVKDQGQCGSCWAFSVTGNVEGQYAIKYGRLQEFSEQELVDCDKLDEGCNGGLMDNAYRAIEKLGGLEEEKDYPYDAEDERCHFNKSLTRVQLSGAVNISHNETDMAKWLVQNGPISIAINANAMQFYVGGVSHPLKFLCSPTNLDHGVLIVGYGVHTYPYFKKQLPFWIIKNSWGTSWGEQGYYRVYRGDGTCGLNQTPSSAIVA